MPTDHWLRIERTYHAALEKEADERPAFLDQACGSDDALRREVESLLEYGAAAGAFLERPALEDEASRVARDPGSLENTEIGGYAILSLIGSGGMGEIYRARDRALGREVAIKVLAHAAAGGANGLRRFESEARLASALNHPNIVTIYGVGEKDDFAYIAMELVRGRTLRDMLSFAPRPIGESLALAVQLADALAAAHASGIVHRDLKPENLMVTPEGLLKVLDFGIAKLRGAAESPGPASQTPPLNVQTLTGAILGTVGYMSPEQAEGRPAEPASDQFSFGAILYEMLSGRRAFHRDTPAATVGAILREEPAPISGLDPAVAPSLRRVLARCLAKSQGDRYRDTRELASQLRLIVELRTGSTAPTRRRLIWLGSAAAVAAAAGLAFWRASPRETGIRTLAVLPFANKGDPNMDYAADGLTRGLIRDISRLSSLTVKPASAAFHFKGKGVDPRAAGGQLSADAVVTGTVRQDGGRLRVTSELIAVATGARLWTASYDAASSDMLSLQDRIARAVVNEGIRLSLSPGDARELARRPTDDPAAYDLYLRAVQLFERGSEADDLESRALLQNAVGRDPNFALAYVALATTHSVMALDGYESPAQALPEVGKYVRRALDIDPNLPDAHSEAAAALFYFRWDWAGSAEEWRLALQSRGGGILPDFLAAYAMQQWALGKPQEALGLVRKARSLDPLSLGLMNREADFLLHAGLLEEAAAQYERVLRATPASAADAGPAVPNAWLGLAELRRQQGRFDDAIEARRRGEVAAGDDARGDLFRTAHGAEGYRQIELSFARADLEALKERAATGDYTSPLDFARVYSRLSDRDQAFAHLESALAERSPGLVFLGVDPAWDPVRGDPRFSAALRRIGLPASS